jgi:hypothetical protein
MRIQPSAFARRTRGSWIVGLLAFFVFQPLACSSRADDVQAAANDSFKFEVMDTDKDGLLSLEEYLANRPGDRAEPGPRGDRDEAKFYKLDSDHDGFVSADEFSEGNGRRWAWWLGGFSIVTFFGSLLAVPLIVARLPEDYFISHHRPADWLKSPRVRIEWLIAKNVLGLLLLAAGIAMLVFPGQGVLTIVLGLMLMDFPGKTRLLNRVAQRPGVLKSINWMRRKAGKTPMLTVPSSRV